MGERLQHLPVNLRHVLLLLRKEGAHIRIDVVIARLLVKRALISKGSFVLLDGRVTRKTVFSMRNVLSLALIGNLFTLVLDGILRKLSDVGLGRELQVSTELILRLSCVLLITELGVSRNIIDVVVCLGGLVNGVECKIGLPRLLLDRDDVTTRHVGMEFIVAGHV